MADAVTVVLSDAEKQTLQAIRTVFAALAVQEEPRASSTVIRVAGGWVRDKILGLESKDIDIAIDNIPIDEFVAAVRRLKHPLVENVAQNENRELRTVMITIRGEQVEFVNLRTSGFGIPDVPPELPKGALDPWIDAYLRDLTINALYFNVNESKVEDWTGKGVEDIKQKVLRTPIKPEDAWRADPHRMLRLIRFATKLDYTIHEEVDANLRRPEVLKMLADISRERFVAELDKIVLSGRVVEGISSILQYQMQKYIIDADAKAGDVWTPLKIEKCRKCLEFGYRIMPEEYLNDPLERQNIIWSLIFAPFCFGAPNTTDYGVSFLPFTKFRMRDVWKFPIKLIDAACAYLGGAETLIRNIAVFSDIANPNLHESPAFLEVAFMLKTLQAKWKVSMCIAKVFSENLLPNRIEDDLFDKLEKYLGDQGITNPETPIWLWKPLFTSEELMKTLSIKGPLVGQAIKECITWQIIHCREGWNKDACREHLLAWRQGK